MARREEVGLSVNLLSWMTAQPYDWCCWQGGLAYAGETRSRRGQASKASQGARIVHILAQANESLTLRLMIHGGPWGEVEIRDVGGCGGDTKGGRQRILDPTRTD